MTAVEFVALSTYGADADRWQAFADSLPPWRRDVHFTPGYARVQNLLGIVPWLLTFKANGLTIAQPVALHHTRVGDEMVHDVTSLYGYGGPVSDFVGFQKPHGEWFDRAVTPWREGLGVVCEFCALNPFLDSQRGLLPEDVEVSDRKQVVVVDLRADPWGGYRDTRRHSIAKARRAPVVVTMEDPTVDENLRAFARLYRETLVRQRAARRWWFPEEYIAGYFRHMPREASLWFARVDGELECAAIILAGHATAYYHLAGNALNWPRIGANDLMLDEIIGWARRQGLKRLHLGGGVTADADDSLLQYKAGFSGARHTVQAYFRVFDQDRYDRLVAVKADEERRVMGHTIESGFVPAYRRDE